MTLYKKNFNINPTLLTNIIFGFFPISFILGNFIINLNVVLFCCLGIFQLKSKILKTKFDFSTKIIFLLFCIIFLSSSLSLIEALYLDEGTHTNLINFTKSIIFFRFFLMLIIVCSLSEFDILDFKYIFISAAFCSLFISLDVIFQYIFGFNIIGLKSSAYHYSGFFGNESIAGGFIQNFSFFSIFFVTFILKNKNNFKFILSTIIICFLGVGIILSGNRMPYVLFLFGLLLTFLFNNELRKIIFVSIIGLLIIFKFITSYDDTLKDRYATYVGHATNIIIGVLNNPQDIKTTEPAKADAQGCFTDPRLKKIYEEDILIKGDPTSFWTSYDTKSGFIKLYYTALDTWKKNKIFGNGMKSFRVDCLRYNYCEIKAQRETRTCSSHPHNYYLEILTDTGIIGLFTTSIIALMFLVFIFKNFKFLNRNNLENLILLAATVSLILKTFPIQSTGSIFSTTNATYLILILSIVLSYKKLLAVKNFK